jgi:hypothetical protein
MRWSNPRLRVDNYYRSINRHGEKEIHFELASLYKLEVLIDRARRLIFHFFCDIFEEASPTRSRPELRNIERGHLDPLISRHDQTAARYVVNVVEIRRRCN